MEFIGRSTKDGGIDLGQRNKVIFKKFLLEHPGALIKISAMLPESNKQRRFYHGAVLPLWAYLDGKDYRDHGVLDDLHELAKLEFNGGFVEVAGKSHKIGRSTQGKAALSQHIERVIEFLVDQYGIDPSAVLDPEAFKLYRDTELMDGGYESYIDYLVATGALKRQ